MEVSCEKLVDPSSSAQLSARTSNSSYVLKPASYALQLKLLSSDQDPRLIHSWRSQDTLLATVIVVGAAIVITWGSSEISSHVFGSPALSDVLDAAIQSARGAVSSIPRLWAALLAALTEGRRAFAATLQSR